MKIGITADLHLTSRENHPDRSNTFINILQQCKEEKVEQLVIAGDLFDRALANHNEFENICKASEFSSIQVLIIPGNHDPDISNTQIISDNVRIFDQPSWYKFDQGWEALFVPYRDSKVMGQIIEEQINNWGGERWVLIGHGDWSENLNEINLYEGGRVYMPLTRKDIEIFKPNIVFLGHIHAPKQMGSLYYAGSPCPIDTSETGYRRFLTLDTETGKIDSARVKNETLYFSADLLIMPMEDETEFVRHQIEVCKQTWEIDPEDLDRAKIRVSFYGYSNNRQHLIKIIKAELQGFEFLQELDISQVYIADDVEKNFMVEKFKEELEQVDYPINKEDEPSERDVLLKAMQLIYGRK